MSAFAYVFIWKDKRRVTLSKIMLILYNGIYFYIQVGSTVLSKQGVSLVVLVILKNDSVYQFNKYLLNIVC